MNTGPSLLELKEYCFAHTEAGIRRPSEDREKHIRELLWIHRFDVFTWLMSNGVALPVELIGDKAHPRPGGQSVDQPVIIQTCP